MYKIEPGYEDGLKVYRIYQRRWWLWVFPYWHYIETWVNWVKASNRIREFTRDRPKSRLRAHVESSAIRDRARSGQE